MDILDIHPHVIVTDPKYPFAPVGGNMSVWARERPVTAEQLVAAMDVAGVARAAIVHASTAYGYDNSYAADSAARFPERFLFVGALDVTAPDSPDRLSYWVSERGMAGLRIFAAGSTMAEDSGSWLDDPKTFPTWERARGLGIPVCVQTRFASFGRLRTLLDRFGDVRIVIDHLAHPPIGDGPPYAQAQAFWDLARYDNLYLKLTERNFHDFAGKGPVRPFLEQVVERFGSDHIAWGSNFPSSPGSLPELLALAQRETAFLQEQDRRAIFHDTAVTLYPRLERASRGA